APGSDRCARLRKYWDYHRRREPDKQHNSRQLGTLRTYPTHPTIKEEEKGASESASPIKKVMPEPEPWRAVCDQIYRRDPKRFNRIAAFPPWAKNRKYSPEEIKAGLELFVEQLDKDNCDGDWWPYATVCLKRAHVQIEQSKSANLKREERKFLADFLKNYGEINYKDQRDDH